MNRNDTNIRLDAALSQKAETILKESGLSLAEAIEIFLTQIIRHEGKPLSSWVEMIPNKKTFSAMKEAKRIANNLKIQGYSDPEELLSDLKK